MEKLGSVYCRRKISRLTDIHWTRQVSTGMKTSGRAKLAVLAPRSTDTQSLSTRKPHWRGTRMEVQASRTGHRAGHKHVAQWVPWGGPALILLKNAPKKHLGYAFKMGSKWGTGYPTWCSAQAPNPIDTTIGLAQSSCKDKCSPKYEIIPVTESGFNCSQYHLRAKFKNRIKDWEMQMCKINEFNNELYVIKVAKIN